MNYQVTVESPSPEQRPLQRKLTIHVPNSVVRKSFEQCCGEVQKTARMKGFRTGLVPLSLVKQHYLKEIRHSLYHELLEKTLKEVVQAEKFNPAEACQIDAPQHRIGKGEHDHELREDQEFQFSATFEICPSVEVKDYKGIPLTRKKEMVTDQLIQESIHTLLDLKADLVPLAEVRPAREGDHVDFNFEGGVVTESGVVPREDMKGNRILRIGGGDFLPEFEAQLVGLSLGESKTFRMTFPANYHAELAGKQAEFQVTVHALKEKKPPQWNEDFALEMGYESLEAFREKIKQGLEQEKAQLSQNQLFEDLCAVLLERHVFEVPQVWVEKARRSLSQEMVRDWAKRGLDQEWIRRLLQENQAQILTHAERKARCDFLFRLISAKEWEHVAPSEDEVSQELVRRAEESKESLEQWVSFYRKNSEALDSLRSDVIRSKVIRFLIQKAALVE